MYLLQELFENFIDDTDQLTEELDPSIDGEEVLYEDNEYSKTPAQADKRRTSCEKELGFELNGNQVQEIATNFPLYYNDPSKYSYLKQAVLQYLDENDLLSEEERKIVGIQDADSEDDYVEYTDQYDDEKFDFSDEQTQDDDYDDLEDGASAQDLTFDLPDSAKTGAELPNTNGMHVQSWETQEEKIKPETVTASEKEIDNAEALRNIGSELVDIDDIDDQDEDMINKILLGDKEKQ